MKGLRLGPPKPVIMTTQLRIRKVNEVTGLQSKTGDERKEI